MPLCVTESPVNKRKTDLPEPDPLLLRTLFFEVGTGTRLGWVVPSVPSLPGDRARLAAVAGPGRGASPGGAGAPRQGRGCRVPVRELALLVGARPPQSLVLRHERCVPWPRRPHPLVAGLSCKPRGSPGRRGSLPRKQATLTGGRPLGAVAGAET